MDTDSNIPVWLDKNFITSILQKEDNTLKQINVTSFRAKPAVAEGNNYCSALIRVNIEFEINHKSTRTSLIVKTPLPSGKGKELIDELGFIEKECLIYRELIPFMNNILGKRLTPKNYICEIPDTIILEDLKEQGYVMCDRLEQLDFDHCNTFMKVIGIFHATFLDIQKRNPELIEKSGVERIYTNDPKPDMKKYFYDGYNFFATALEEWEGFEHYTEFIRNNMNALWDRVVSIHNGKKHIKVLNHSDAWTNNMLFKHDDTGKIIDMKLIDFQICTFASPALDLHLFIATSAQEEVKQHRLPELYSTYLDSFNSTLESIGCEERLSLEELQNELKFMEVLPFSLLPDFTPTVLCEKDNVMNIVESVEAWENYDKNENSKMKIQKMLNGKHYKKVAMYTIKTLEDQGFFESF